MKISNFLKLFITISVSELAGVVGSFFTVSSVSSWYLTLPKPFFSPPSWVFGPVWILLYFLMGVAAFLIWQKGLEKKEVKIALIFFAIQLFFNTLWSIIFFGLHNPFLAFIEIIILWISILATSIYFFKISRVTLYLLLPYILWVTFAVYLNFSIWQLSKNIPQNIACTQEAKLCPNGSAVGRVGPNCEFESCPTDIQSSFQDESSFGHD